MPNTMTKKRRVINYLATGKGLTEAEARSRFGVGNLRAVANYWEASAQPARSFFSKD